MNPWLTFSLVFLSAWVVLYVAFPRLRSEMRWASVLTAPLGLTEPLFVPEYWSPPSLLDLAARTSFDIESIIFCFAIGGIGAVFYESLIQGRHKHMTHKEQCHPRHRYHAWALSSPLLAFIPLYGFTTLNPIYSATIAMLIGAVAAMLCRPDLLRQIFIGGVLLLALYALFFGAMMVIYPGIIAQVWNLQVISGILVMGIPLEELLFAFTFGMLWSSMYEHALWFKVIPSNQK